MKLQRIDHIGIAVKNLDESIRLYRDVLGLELLAIEEVAREKVRTAIFKIGESKIELLESTSPDGPIAKHIEKRGEGVAHIAFGVDNVEQSFQHLKNQIKLLNESPQEGAHQSQIFFAHPKETGGVLFEFCQKKE